MRQSSEQLGRGYLRLVRRLWPGHPAVAALDAVETWRSGGAGGRAEPGWRGRAAGAAGARRVPWSSA